MACSEILGRKFTPAETIFDHMVLGPPFALWLVFHPGATVRVLKTEGVGGIGRGYRKFFGKMRPELY